VGPEAGTGVLGFASGMTIIKTPVRAPHANGIAERVVGIVRRELPRPCP
jgi:hypothetical protein